MVKFIIFTDHYYSVILRRYENLNYEALLFKFCARKISPEKKALMLTGFKIENNINNRCLQFVMLLSYTIYKNKLNVIFVTQKQFKHTPYKYRVIVDYIDQLSIMQQYIIIYKQMGNNMLYQYLFKVSQGSVYCIIPRDLFGLNLIVKLIIQWQLITILLYPFQWRALQTSQHKKYRRIVYLKHMLEFAQIYRFFFFFFFYARRYLKRQTSWL
eukprot:TRINITY_DN6783_c0_g1_i1.p1 TRINITY_DN6783_c0_g1~~TRINITY_DN6783_c0_g1_i1.p1  ORF type:complete len:213 (-),score=-12.83 TRINITY_DN6783_c0_g1_i1:69-707(-)